MLAAHSLKVPLCTVPFILFLYMSKVSVRNGSSVWWTLFSAQVHSLCILLHDSKDGIKVKQMAHEQQLYVVV